MQFRSKRCGGSRLPRRGSGPPPRRAVQHHLSRRGRTSIARFGRIPVALRYQTRRRRNVEPFMEVGELITMGRVSANTLIHNSLAGEKELLDVSDVAIRFIGACPVGSRCAERVVMALSNFLGHDRPRMFYTERAPELVSSIRRFRGLHTNVRPVSQRAADQGHCRVPRQAGHTRYQDLVVGGRIAARVVTLCRPLLLDPSQYHARQASRLPFCQSTWRQRIRRPVNSLWGVGSRHACTRNLASSSSRIHDRPLSWAMICKAGDIVR